MMTFTYNKQFHLEKRCPNCGNKDVPKESVQVPKLIVCKECGYKFFQLRG